MLQKYDQYRKWDRLQAAEIRMILRFYAAKENDDDGCCGGAGGGRLLWRINKVVHNMSAAMRTARRRRLRSVDLMFCGCAECIIYKYTTIYNNFIFMYFPPMTHERTSNITRILNKRNPLRTIGADQVSKISVYDFLLSCFLIP